MFWRGEKFVSKMLAVWIHVAEQFGFWGWTVIYKTVTFSELITPTTIPNNLEIGDCSHHTTWYVPSATGE